MGVKNEQWNFIAKIPEEMRPALREALAEEIIYYIRERTQSGKDKDGRKFGPYSKEYIKSLDFRNAGKSKGKVNLTLSGDMLASIKLISHRPGEIKIGFEKGSEENARAEGNILGTYGNAKQVAPSRNFLGIEKKKLSAFVNEFMDYNTAEDAKVIEAIKEGEEKVVKMLVKNNKDLSTTVEFARGVFDE